MFRFVFRSFQIEMITLPTIAADPAYLNRFATTTTTTPAQRTA